MSIAREPTRFDVFISYNRSDQTLVTALAVSLQDAGLSVWVDTTQMRAGTNWREQLEEDLNRSAACIIVSGPNGYGRVQAQERGLAYVIRDERPNFHIVNVLLPGAPSPGASLVAVDTWVRFHGGVDEPDALAALVAGVKGTQPQTAIAATLPDDPAPYRGLSAFGTEDDRLFFGRRTEIEQLMSRLASTRFLAVIGNSGSGKTSIVQAGLIPAVRRNGIGDVRHWQAIVVQPGTAPLRSLALALAKAQAGVDPLVAAETRFARLSAQPGAAVDIAKALLNDGHGLLLVVDRLEEVFTIAETVSESERFIDALLRLAAESHLPTRVVVTLRADFYGKLDRHPGLAALLSDHQTFIQPLGADGAMEAIENPAACVGAMFEKGLASQLCSDVTSQKRVMLPVLQLALDLLWIRRRGRWLTWDAYREMGRVDGALQYHADRAIAAVGERENIARRLLCRLVWVGDNGQTSSRRCEKAALLDDGDAGTGDAEVLQHLVNSRLILISDDDAIPQAELIHDTLTTDWHWLQAAVQVDRDFLQWRQILDGRRKEAAQGQEDTEPLLHGRSLEVAERWLMARRDDLSAAEREFIEHSRTLTDFDAARAAWRSAVTSACGRWLGSRKSLQELAAGEWLEQSMQWVRHLNTALAAEEQMFITASVALDLKRRLEAILSAQQENRRQERRHAARQRYIYWLGVVRTVLPYAVVSLVLMAVASWAWVRSDRYQTNAVLAQARGVIENNSVITREGARWIRVIVQRDASLGLAMARHKPNSSQFNPHSREAVYLLLELADAAPEVARESLGDALAIVRAGGDKVQGNEEVRFQGDDVELLKTAAERHGLDDIAREAKTLFEEIWHRLRETVDFRIGLIYLDETPTLLAWAKHGRLNVDALSLWEAAIATTVFRRNEMEVRAIALSRVFETIPDRASLTPALAAIAQLDGRVHRRSALGGLLRGLISSERLNDVVITLETTPLDTLDGTNVVTEIEPPDRLDPREVTDLFHVVESPDPGRGALMSVFTALATTRPGDAKRLAARLERHRIAAGEAIVMGIALAGRRAEAQAEFEALRRAYPEAPLWDAGVAVARLLIAEKRFDDTLRFADQHLPSKVRPQIRALVAEALFKAGRFEDAMSLIPAPVDRYGLESIAAAATTVTLEPNKLRLLQLVKDAIERAEPALDKAAAGRALSRMGAVRDARRLANSAPPDSPVRQVIAEEIVAHASAKARSRQPAQG